MSFKTKFLNFLRQIFIFPIFEKWLKKITKGKSSSSFVCKLVPNNYQYKPNTYRVFDWDKIKLKVDLYDYVGHYLYFGFKDSGHIKLMEMVNENDLILDIGTNIGSTILKFASLTKNNVYGFEPDDFNFKICQENISLNHFNNINVENIGLGNIAGTYKLSIDTDSNRGGNRISFNNDLQTYTTIKVETLDAWVETKDLQKIDLIKIDVEGFEMKVLEGGKKTISKFMPKLFIELDDNNLRNVGNSAKELIDFLQNLDYNVIMAESGQRIESNYNFENKHFDIICEKK